MTHRIIFILLIIVAFTSCRNNKNIKQENSIIRKDSIVEEKIICKELHTYYDKQGNIQEKGCQGLYNGMKVPVGTWSFYNKGCLVKEIYYHNDEFGKDYILFKYFNKGKMYKELITNNFILYETDSILLTRKEYLKRIK